MSKQSSSPSNWKIFRTSQSLVTSMAVGFFAFSAVILLAFGALQWFYNIRTQQSAISEQEQLTAQSAAKTVSNFIEQQLSTLSATAWLTDPSVTTPKEQNQALTYLLAHQRAFRHLVIFDAQNHRTAAVTRVQTNSQQASDRFVLRVSQEVLHQAPIQDVYISPVYFDEVNEPVVLLAVPMIDSSNNYKGVLAAELNLVSMWNAVNSIRVGGTGYAYVVDKNGTLIAFENAERVLNQENVGGLDAVGRFMRSSSSAISTYQGISGERVVGTYAALGIPDWAVVIELPWDEAFRNVIQTAGVSIVFILIMAALAALAGGYVARGLTRPLVQLTNTATRIAGGETQMQAALEGPPEVVSLATAFNSMTAQVHNLIGALEKRVAERTEGLEQQTLRLRAAAEVARDAAAAPSIDELLDRAARLIRERFNLYHTGIFLIDEKKEYAVLYASPTEAGQQMLANHHRLRVGAEGIVGRVAATGEPRIALDTGVDPTYFSNPYLPNTRSEMSLPFKSNEGVIGVLDVQSDQPEAFTQDDIAIMQVMADLLSTAIEKTRLVQQVQNSLQELERTYGSVTEQSWKVFERTARQTLGYRYDNIHLEPLREIPHEALNVLEQNAPISDSLGSDAKESMAIPVRLRGQTIGVIQVRFQNKDEAKATTVMIEQIADRLATALENTRLLEDSLNRANKERVIGEITSKISASINMRNVLQTAVEELGRAIPGSDVVIQLVGDDRSNSEEK